MKFTRHFWYFSLAISFVFCLYTQHFWMRDQLRISFLDIGQGDSIFIQTPHGRTVLIDGGPGTDLVERLGEQTSFWMKTINLLILTHPDRDHLEGFLEIIPRYSIENVLLTGIVHESQLYRSFLDMLEEHKIQTLIASPDQDWQIDEEVYLDILSPSVSHVFEEVDHSNDTSIVAKLMYGNTSILLPGDAEALQEKEMLLTDFDLRSEFLKSGHHGSRTSSGIDFLRSVQAKQSVITSGRENTFDHPHVETVLRYDDFGMEWWNTKDEGTITFASDGREWRRE